MTDVNNMRKALYERKKILETQPETKWIHVVETDGSNTTKKKHLVRLNQTKDIDYLKADLTNSLKPTLGPVRNIYTPAGGTEVKSLDQIHPDKEYLAGAGNQNFKKISQALKTEARLKKRLQKASVSSQGSVGSYNSKNSTASNGSRMTLMQRQDLIAKMAKENGGPVVKTSRQTSYASTSSTNEEPQPMSTWEKRFQNRKPRKPLHRKPLYQSPQRKESSSSENNKPPTPVRKAIAMKPKRRRPKPKPDTAKSTVTLRGNFVQASRLTGDNDDNNGSDAEDEDAEPEVRSQHGTAKSTYSEIKGNFVRASRISGSASSRSRSASGGSNYDYSEDEDAKSNKSHDSRASSRQSGGSGSAGSRSRSRSRSESRSPSPAASHGRSPSARSRMSRAISERSARSRSASASRSPSVRMASKSPSYRSRSRSGSQSRSASPQQIYSRSPSRSPSKAASARSGLSYTRTSARSHLSRRSPSPSERGGSATSARSARSARSNSGGRSANEVDEDDNLSYTRNSFGRSLGRSIVSKSQPRRSLRSGSGRTEDLIDHDEDANNHSHRTLRYGNTFSRGSTAGSNRFSIRGQGEGIANRDGAPKRESIFTYKTADNSPERPRTR